MTLEEALQISEKRDQIGMEIAEYCKPIFEKIGREVTPWAFDLHPSERYWMTEEENAKLDELISQLPHIWEEREAAKVLVAHRRKQRIENAKQKQETW